MDITWVFSKQGQEESSQENIEVLEYSNYVQVCDSVMPSNTSKREGLA